MNPLLWVAVCAGTVLCVSITEYINRTAPDFSTAMMHSVAFITVSQIGLYFIFSKAPSIMAAWLAFTVGMSLVRVLSSMYVLDEPLNAGWLLIGVGFTLAASLAIKQAHG